MSDLGYLSVVKGILKLVSFFRLNIYMPSARVLPYYASCFWSVSRIEPKRNPLIGLLIHSSNCSTARLECLKIIRIFQSLLFLHLLII